MTGMFWNCRGVGKKGMTTCFFDLIRDHSLDFIGLQETMKKKFSPKFLREVDPLDRYTWNWTPSIGKSGGILCGIKKENLDIISWVLGSFLIQANIYDIKKCASGLS